MSAFNDRVSLTVGGRQHSGWSYYEIDSNLLIPADGWQLRLALESGRLPPVVTRGAPVEVRVNDKLVLTGRIDTIRDKVAKDSHTLTIAGRDAAAVLADCSAPIFVSRKATLPEVVSKVVTPLGITKVRIESATSVFEKVNVEPGDSAWEVLAHAAEANGLWPWFDPDGTLVIGGPDYTRAPVATLVKRFSGKGNNVESIERVDSIARCYSEITVLSQSHTTELEAAKTVVKATYRDPSVPWYRPRIVIDHEANSQQAAADRAQKLQADSRLNGFTLEAEVAGHTIHAPGAPGNGLLWTPGQRVDVLSEPHDINATFFMIGRRLSGGRDRPTLTRLTLKEDGMWVIKPHPHNKRHRRGRNGIAGGEGQIYEVDG
ncbi:Mu P family protein [Cupriavidus basilensis OR16]|uniref:Mu P family protein n=1 Tax=Cupriavidus basilensis OR16 TaxID=1127483 RepID=H1SDH8_9BURK|nr:hypothetical protein [Cupriavidus basilensis]EHP39432.1 Mu P family protein [Cupriavidus basilensis OR16]